MEKVKRLRKAGATITGAIREALLSQGLTVGAFADKYERSAANMSSIINGGRAPAQKDVDAFVAELGGSDTEWRELLHEAGRPQKVAS